MTRKGTDATGIEVELAELLEAQGFERPEGSAFVRTNLLTSLVFLIADVTGAQEPIELAALVAKARAWCVSSVGATWVTKEAGLNLIVLHAGQIEAHELKGLPDATGAHAAILQSVTAIDRERRTVVQAKSWLVIGRVRRVLRTLSRID